MTTPSPVSATPSERAAVDVILCAELAKHASLDVEELRGRLCDALPEARILVVKELCADPHPLRDLARRLGFRRLVLGICQGVYDSQALQAAVRKAGLDIHAVEKVAVAPATAPPPDATDELVLRFRAAAARAAAFTRGGPEQLRPRLLAQSRPVSRRSLLSLAPLTYEAIAGIDEDACLGWKSCSLCARACPVRAIGPSGDSLVVDRDACVACGICVSTCPVGAADIPGSSLAQYEAQLRVLLAPPRQPIVFACRRALESRQPAETPASTVELPCLGTVTVGWVLQALAAGAPAVDLVSCGSDCRVKRWPIMRARVDFVLQLLAELGDHDPTGRVRIVTGDGDLTAGSRPPRRDAEADAVTKITLSEPRAAVEAVLRLRERYGAGELELPHPESPLGFVEMREETCTTCGTCAEVCPTGALAVEGESATRAVSFDPSLCVACGRCASFCPEQAFDTLTVVRTTRPGELERGRRTLAHSRQTLCTRCGRPVAPSAMLDRIEAMLEGSDGSDALLSTLRRLCADCRGLAQFSDERDGSPPG